MIKRGVRMKKRRNNGSTAETEAPLLAGDQEGGRPASSDAVPTTGYAKASLLSRSLWLWLHPLLRKGASTTLQASDVPLLAEEDRAEAMLAFFQSNWPTHDRDDTACKPHPVRTALLRCFGCGLVFTGMLALLRVMGMYTGPLLIQSFVGFIEGGRREAGEGLLLVLVLLISKFVEVLCFHQHNFLSQKLGMQMRSSLLTNMYRKALCLSSSSRQSHAAGQIVNYASIDVQQVNDSIVQLHNLWMLPLQVVIALLILYREIGLAALAGLVSMIIFSAGISYNSSLTKKYTIKSMMKKDKRAKSMTEALNCMRIIKLQAWEVYFRESIEAFRELEYGWITKFSYALAANLFLLGSTTAAVTIVSIGTCLLLKIELNAAKIFTVISTFNVLSEPLRTFPQAVISVSQALVSLNRLDKFMLSKELEDYVEKSSPIDDDNDVIAIDSGSFAWDEDTEQPNLHNLNIHVSKGSLVAIVGTVGAGKSSLLSAFLGEMPKLSGTVRVCGSTAYVPQTAWVQNATIKENILFGAPLNEAKYKRTLAACALEQDLLLLEGGDQTEIGERGINLSGGQKQRVQLARAVYQDSDVYFLDDVFSAVDAQTGSHLFKECLLGVLCKKTRILVTHQVEFLQGADLIIVLSDGVIVESGKYKDLFKDGTEFSSLVAAHKEALEKTRKEDENNLEQLEDTMDKSLMRIDSSEKTKSRVVRKSSSIGPESNEKPTNSKLIEDEERESGRVGWNVYWMYLTKAFGFPYVILVVLIQLTSQGFSIGSDFWLANETTTASFNPVAFIRVYALLCIASWILAGIRGALMAVFGLKTAQTLFLEMLRSVFRAPMFFFDTTPTGRILTRSSSDQATVDILLPLSFSLALILYTATIGILIVTCEVAWPSVFLVLLLTWIYISYQKFYISSSREITRLDSITKAPVIHHFTETIAGFTVVRSFSRVDSFMNENLSRVNTNLKMDFHFQAATEWLGFRLEMIGITLLCAAALLLVLLPENAIKPEMAALCLSYGLSLNTMLAASVFFSCMIENKMVAVERIGQFTHLPEEAPYVIEGKLPSSSWPDEGKISIKGLKVRYLPSSPLVLKGISLDIEGGQKIGVVGRTGSGKSTLIQVIFRIIEPSAGSILIDGIDIASLGLYDLRSKLGIIPQEPVLFEGTVRTNMDPLGMHSDEDIWEGLKKCQLADVVMGKEGKLDSTVMDNGGNWSVGQRQLLCLGRALLKRSQILFLDEATASVDTQTDALLQNIIRQEFIKSTVISIAHRIPSVMDSDKVMVLDAGRLAEYNSPLKLLDQPTSLFSALVKEYSTRSQQEAALD